MKPNRRAGLTEAQRACLRCHDDGGGPGESWAQYSDGHGKTALQWANHERMLDGLARRGLLDAVIF